MAATASWVCVTATKAPLSRPEAAGWLESSMQAYDYALWRRPRRRGRGGIELVVIVVNCCVCMRKGGEPPPKEAITLNERILPRFRSLPRCFDHTCSTQGGEDTMVKPLRGRKVIRTLLAGHATRSCPRVAHTQCCTKRCPAVHIDSKLRSTNELWRLYNHRFLNLYSRSTRERPTLRCSGAPPFIAASSRLPTRCCEGAGVVHVLREWLLAVHSRKPAARPCVRCI